mgnify:CR=1 FL=1
MATFTAASGGGNWNDAATWEEGGGYPQAGDNAVFDSGSGNVTVNVDSACNDITCTGYTGTLTLGANLTVYGNLLFVSGMTFTPSTYTVIFAATSSGKTITSGGKTFYNVEFNGSGGVWTLQDNFTLATYPARSYMTAGTLNINGKTFKYQQSVGVLTLGSGFVLNVGSGKIDGGAGLGMVVPSGATMTISTGTWTGSSFTVSGTGTCTCTGAATIQWQSGTVTITSANWTPGTATLNASYGSDLKIDCSQPIYNLTLGRNYFSVKLTLLQDLTVQNNVTVTYNSGYTHTLDCDSYTLTVGGNFTNDDVFTAGTGTVVFNDAAKTSTISGSGTITFNVLRCTTPGKALRFTNGKTYYMAELDLTGSGAGQITLDTSTGSGTFTFSDSTGTNQVEYCTITRSDATGGATWLAYTSDGNVDGGGNSGWVFTVPSGDTGFLQMF